LFIRNGVLTLTYDTFSGNTAAQGGTDVYVLSDGSGNQATASLVNDILGQISNTVTDFVSNTNNSGTAPNLGGSSNNLVRNNGGLPNSAVVSSADPLLFPPASNGGPTQTMALSSNSPAYQQGVVVSGITTDQRGYVRPSNHATLGAFDPLATIPLPPSPPPSPTPSPTPSKESSPVNLNFLFLAEDQFALSVDSILSLVSSAPQLTQAGDQLMIMLNNLLGLDNPALGTGLDGLQSAFNPQVVFDTLWGYVTQLIELDLAQG
jgi:hypothetical protein